MISFDYIIFFRWVGSTTNQFVLGCCESPIVTTRLEAGNAGRKRRKKAFLVGEQEKTQRSKQTLVGCFNIGDYLYIWAIYNDQPAGWSPQMVVIVRESPQKWP